jgi:hypothetical protein
MQEEIDLNKNEGQPKFVFIAGTPRSSGTVTLASLDDHPDILAWPSDLIYFPFFYRIAGGRKEVPIAELNNEFIKVSFNNFRKRLEHGDGLYADDISSSAVDNHNIGNFDYQLFLRCLNAEKDKYYNAVDYLAFIFKCLKYSSSRYRDKPVKYYVLLTGARGLDWHNEDLFKSSMFLYSYRDAEYSYASIREKQIKNYDINILFSLTGKKSLLFWLETYRRISTYAKIRVDMDNFMVVPQKKLQEDTEIILKDICSFLKIDPHPNIFSLSTGGSPYRGNAREGKLNTGKIAKRTSKPRTPLSVFEQRIFALLDLFDFPEHKKRDFSYFGFCEMLKTAFLSAFIEIPHNKIRRGSSSNLMIFLGRVKAFCNLCSIYLVLKNDWIKMKLIRKGNKHIINDSFWVTK